MSAVEDLPVECLVEILEQLSVADISSAGQVSRVFREGATADCLWRSLCVREKHGGVLDFQELLGCFSHPDARPLTPATLSPPGSPPPLRRSSSSAAGKPWIEVYKLSTTSLRSTICIDTGRGYAKYGIASAAQPSNIQICQPRAEATQDSLYKLALRRLGLRRCDLPGMAMIVSEPFRLAAASADKERESWRRDTEKHVLHGLQLKRLCIVDSASLCLFANKLTSGVVLNIGFGAIFVVPVLGGRIIRSAVRTLRLGGASLTQLFAELLSYRGVEPNWHPSMGGEPIAPITVARNLKECACEVSPTPLRERFGHSPFSFDPVLSRPDAPIKEVQLGGACFSLGWERFLPAELLFEPQEMVSGARGGLHELVLHAVDATVTAECDGPAASDTERQRLRHELLGRVVLSGGSAAMPGLALRLQHELTRLLRAGGGPVPPVTVFPAREGDHTTWFGAAVLAGTSTFAEHWCVHAPTAPTAPAQTGDKQGSCESDGDDGGGGSSEFDDEGQYDDDNDDDDEGDDDDDDDGEGDEGEITTTMMEGEGEEGEEIAVGNAE